MNHRILKTILISAAGAAMIAAPAAASTGVVSADLLNSSRGQTQ